LKTKYVVIVLIFLAILFSGCVEPSTDPDSGPGSTPEIKTCAEQNGSVCTGEQECTGALLTTSDSDQCCSIACIVQEEPGPGPGPNLSDEPQVKISDVTVLYDRIELNSNGNGVQNVIFRLTNETELEKRVEYYVKFTLLNTGGEAVSETNSKSSLYQNVTNIGFKKFTTGSLEVVSSGEYDLRTEFFISSESEEVLATLTKRIKIGPSEETVIRAPKVKEEPVEASEVTISDVTLSYDKVSLNSNGSGIDQVVLRLVNKTDFEQRVEYYTKFLIVNETGETVSVTNATSSLYMNVQNIVFKNYNTNFFYSVNPGTYTLVAEFYKDGSNILLASITKEVEIGPAATTVIFAERSAQEFEANSSVTLSDVKVEYNKVTLNSKGDSVSKVELKLSNTTQTDKRVEYYTKFNLVNGDGKLISTTTSSSSLYMTVEDVEYKNYNTNFFYSVNPGTYTLVAEFYKDGSNILLATLTKEVDVSPTAVTEQ